MRRSGGDMQDAFFSFLFFPFFDNIAYFCVLNNQEYYPDGRF